MKRKVLESKRAIFYAWMLFAVLLGMIIWTVWGNTALMVSTVDVSGSRIPGAFDGLRIAQVSDLHNAVFGKDHAKLIHKLSECEPDIIVITGDLVDAERTDLDAALDFAKGAVEIADTYYVTGNHEACLPQYGELQTALERIGVIVLDDVSMQLEYHGERVMLIGLSDPDFTRKRDILGEVSAMADAKLRELMGEEDSYTILLSHRPELFETYVSCGVDLVFSGHAHGGQFRLPFVGGLIAPNQGLFPKYDSGLYVDGGTSMVVSRGIGNSIIPFRFNNRPEIVLLVLHSDSNGR